MSVRILALMLIGSLTACGASTAQSSSSGPSAAKPTPGLACGPAAARTLAADPVARVYVTSDGTVRGCAHGAARAWALGQSGTRPGAERLGQVAVSGTTVVYSLTRMMVDTGSATITERRLSDGSVLAQQPANTARLRPESFVTVSRLVLAAGGGFAWISVAESIIGHSRTIQVHGFLRGATRVLDGGPAIATDSLRLTGRRVSWRHGADVRSAPLG